MSELKVRLAKPHAKQAAFIGSPAKRKCVVAGRRGGKTTAARDMAVKGLLDGRRVLEAAPTADQTTAFWDGCKKALAEPIAAGLVRKNETERLLECAGTRGRIRAKTAWDADSLRGDYADLLILDEYSIMDPSAWDEVGAPMLLDNDGDAIVIFTPKRRNHAHKLYTRAMSDTTGRWGAWHFTSLDNPYLSQAALAEITQDMSAEAYRQEILAEFLEGEGAVFRNIPACLHAPVGATLEQHRYMGADGKWKYHNLLMGCDWGKANDFTTFSVVCATCHVEVALDRSNQVDYALQRGRLRTLYDKWAVAQVVAESNSMGEPIIEQLQREGIRVVPFQTTAMSKPPLIEALVLAFEREQAQWLDLAVATSELEAYERKVSANTGHSSYSAPEGVHDDTVMARALAWHAICEPPRKPLISFM
jgi:hypothetical protein